MGLVNIRSGFNASALRKNEKRVLTMIEKQLRRELSIPVRHSDSVFLLSGSRAIGGDSILRMSVVTEV